MNSEFDFLIVGAGFAGCVLAERLAGQQDMRVLLIDKRGHIGGNAYDCFNSEGILIHPYGPHIFHTNSERIFGYLSQFTEWRPYSHEVRASVLDVDSQPVLVPIPINLDTINELYKQELTSEQLEHWFTERAEPRDVYRTSEDVVVSKIGVELYEKFFKGYTRKQWGVDASELDAQVTARVPVRTNRDCRYFTDTHQFMPRDGYTKMFERMLKSPNIEVRLGTTYKEVSVAVKFQDLIFTGPVDEFFDFKFGRLPYRSVSFRHETVDTEWVFPVGVVNYPEESVPHTRITEMKHITGQTHPKSALITEFANECGPNDDPYYPVPNSNSAALYRQYAELASRTPGVHFVGRLGTYRYYNMDQVVGQALATFDRLTGQNRYKNDRREDRRQEGGST